MNNNSTEASEMKKINWWPLAQIIVKHTPLMEKRGYAGYQNKWRAYISPEHADDPGLLAHELEHVKQWWLTFGLLSILYPRIKSVRQWAETGAFRAQLRAYPQDHRDYYVDALAKQLSEQYDFGISYEQARKAIS